MSAERLRPDAGPPRPGDGLVAAHGRTWYAVPDVDELAPFLMSVVGDGDRWMFISSAGPLTAGRGDATRALFPYETDDRLHRARGVAGGVTSIRVGDDLWRPFDPEAGDRTARRLLKTVDGDAVWFEATHPDRSLLVSSRWATCEAFGFVRTTTVACGREHPIEFEILDGLVGVLPYGLDPQTTQRLSNLSNAYRRSELVTHGRRPLALYTIESPVSDRAEPEEVLRATAVWSVGFDPTIVTLDSDAIARFERSAPEPERSLLTGCPGAYLLRRRVTLSPGDELTWNVVADVALDHVGVAALLRRVDEPEIEHALTGALAEATDGLRDIVWRADGLQHTGDRTACAHHQANSTFNVMRGGIPLDGYGHSVDDFGDFVATRNRRVAARHDEWARQLPLQISRRALLAAVAERGDPQLERLAAEYLPFSFSRRHGDPSRPWNSFSVRVRDDDGQPVTHYEGNWRDVFQNWEALCASFPEYLPGIIALFVNATTTDGFNPYRITRDGIDWEEPDPHDPWANIGYWGDHQLVYLLRLIEAADRYLPGAVAGMITRRCHTYADVPYRLAPYPSLLRDPKVTIEFDGAAADRSRMQVTELGGDGKLLLDGGGDPVLVTMLEKLLVPFLSKLSNFVPGGGIWMNTQRPEWNDANNALVGYGVSMVTLFHLRSFLGRLRSIGTALDEADRSAGPVDVSAEVVAWMEAVTQHLRRLPVDPSGADRHRREVMDALGQAFSDHRTNVYEHGFSGATSVVRGADVVALCDAASPHLDATIRSSRRADGLVHSYSLIRVHDGGVGIEHLPEMLEGQVAALGTPSFSPEERADLTEALFRSALYREDRHSFLLAPVRMPPPFLAKNVIPSDAAATNPLLTELIDAGRGGLVHTDVDGTVRFHADLTDRKRLESALDELAGDPRWGATASAARSHTLAIYDDVFDHRSFIGRSGSMYAYEGIGSIYWHMVTKLLLALQEAAVETRDAGASADVVERLIAAYWSVRAGLGFNKRASEFGAIPTDPYSHTPAHAGAQQPGMTGAVKEQLLARWLEVGVRVEAGEIVFDPLFLRQDELLVQAETWTVPAGDGTSRTIELAAGTLGFTLCRVPVIVETGQAATIDVEYADGRLVHVDGPRLGRPASAAVFGETGEVKSIRARLAVSPT